MGLGSQRFSRILRKPFRFCRKVLRNVSHSKKPVEQRFCRTLGAKPSFSGRANSSPNFFERLARTSASFPEAENGVSCPLPKTGGFDENRRKFRDCILPTKARDFAKTPEIDENGENGGCRPGKMTVCQKHYFDNPDPLTKGMGTNLRFREKFSAKKSAVFCNYNTEKSRVQHRADFWSNFWEFYPGVLEHTSKKLPQNALRLLIST